MEAFFNADYWLFFNRTESPKKGLSPGKEKFFSQRMRLEL
jgi:hypothetical protein